MTYLDRVLSKFDDLQETSSGWVCTCPCPGHGADGLDSSPSLRISVGEEGRVLVVCRTGCPLQSILAAVNLEARDLHCPPGETPAERLVAPPQEISGAQAALRHKVYTALLHRLGLEAHHKKDLKARGLPATAINRGEYRSLKRTDAGPLAHALYHEFGELLYQVPGFYAGPRGPAMRSFTGVVIPCRNPAGEVLALKVRQDDADPKYVYISHAENSCGVVAHCPLYGNRTHLARVTEGELKAEVAAERTGVYTVSVPGVNNWAAALPVLKQLGVREVLVSFDWPDVQSKPQVRRAVLSFLSALKEQSFTCGVEVWEEEAKGVDDALLANLPLTCHWGPNVDRLFTTHVVTPHAAPEWVPRPFPLEVFPDNLRQFVVQTSATLQSPPDWISLGILVAVGRALGTARRIYLDPNYGEFANLYGVIVADPGKLKTAAMKWAMGPVLRRQQSLSEDLDKYKQLKRQWERRLKVDRLMRRDPTEQPAELQEHRELEHVYVENCTVEAALVLMHKNLSTGRRDSSLLTFHDELTAWVRSMNAYRAGQGADRNFALACWSVNQTKVDRKTNEETLTICHPCMSVFGGVQPELLSEFEDKKGRNDGFMDRLLFTCPPCVGVWAPEEEPRAVPPELARVWDDAFDFLWDYVRPLPDGPKPVTPANKEVRSLWVQWGQRHAAEQTVSGFPRSYVGPWSKLRGYYARFALILHYLWLACQGEESLVRQGRLFKSASSVSLVEGSIDADDLRRAELLVEYYKDHHKAARREARCDPEERLVAEFADWVASQGGSVTTREVARSRRFFSSASEIEGLFRKAADLGYGVLTAKRAGTDRREGARFTLETDSP